MSQTRRGFLGGVAAFFGGTFAVGAKRMEAVARDYSGELLPIAELAKTETKSIEKIGECEMLPSCHTCIPCFAHTHCWGPSCVIYHSNTHDFR